MPTIDNLLTSNNSTKLNHRLTEYIDLLLHLNYLRNTLKINLI